MIFAKKKNSIVSEEDALPGRQVAAAISKLHFVNQREIKGPYREGCGIVYLGLGCFWGAERRFWQVDGVWLTAVGFGAGYTPNASYDEVCTGMTGHNELVMVVYDNDILDLDGVLTIFFEAHDPTQGLRQGNDVGSQYRSGIYVFDDEQFEIASAARERYGLALSDHGYGSITTEIVKDAPFYFAEDYHQQYLAKNPDGYCSLKGTDVSFGKT